MSESQRALLYGDPYRVEEALASRHAAILTEFADTERLVLFGDELDLPSLRIMLLSGSLFVQGRHFVVRHAKAIQGPKQFVVLVNQELPEATFLTLLADEMKPSNPVFKAMKERGSVQAVPRVKGKALERAATAILADCNVKLGPAALKCLVNRSGGELLDIFQEARKLHALCPEGTPDEDVLAQLFFAAGEPSIYPLLDRVGERNLPATLAFLSSLHEDPGRIFSMLLRHLTRILMVRVLVDTGATTARAGALLGSPGWLIRRLLNQAKHSSRKELSAAVDLGVTLDLAVKSGEIRSIDALLKLIFAATSPGLRAPEYARRNRPARAAIC